MQCQVHFKIALTSISTPAICLILYTQAILLISGCSESRSQSDLSAAIKTNDASRVSELIHTSGTDVLLSDGNTLLSLAIRVHATEVAGVLLKNGINAERADKGGSLPLVLSAGMQERDIVNLLLGKNIDVNKREETGYKFAALHQCAISGSLDIAQILLEHGADKNIQDSIGRTPLILCAEFKNFPVAEELIRRGAILDFQDKHGRTVLHAAVERGFVPLVKILLAAHASTEIKNEWGDSPRQMAKRLTEKKIIDPDVQIELDAH